MDDRISLELGLGFIRHLLQRRSSRLGSELGFGLDGLVSLQNPKLGPDGSHNNSSIYYDISNNVWVQQTTIKLKTIFLIKNLTSMFTSTIIYFSSV